MEADNEMNNLTIKKSKIKSVRLFVLRLIGYISVGLIIPMGFLIWRFNLFSSTSKLNIGGWGMVVIIFTTVFLIKLINKASQTVESELLKQIFNAIQKVFLPLLAVTLCIYAVGDFWQELIHFFIVLTICEPIAYVLNPFPELIAEKEKENKKNGLLNVIETFWDKKK